MTAAGPDDQDAPSWPPSAAHYHGFDRAVIVYVRYEDDSGGYPVGMVDGMENHRAPRGLWEQRREEWHDWWRSDPDRESHSCRPAWRCIVASWGEVITLAMEEGRALPSWVVPS